MICKELQECCADETYDLKIREDALYIENLGSRRFVKKTGKGII